MALSFELALELGWPEDLGAIDDPDGVDIDAEVDFDVMSDSDVVDLEFDVILDVMEDLDVAVECTLVVEVDVLKTVGGLRWRCCWLRVTSSSLVQPLVHSHHRSGSCHCRAFSQGFYVRGAPLCAAIRHRPRLSYRWQEE